MGARDLINPWGNEMPPVVVVSRGNAVEISPILQARFEEASRKMDELEAKWIADGRPWTDDDEAFLNRMTGF